MEIRAGKHAKGLEEVTDFVSVIFSSFFPPNKDGFEGWDEDDDIDNILQMSILPPFKGWFQPLLKDVENDFMHICAIRGV